MPPDTLVIPVLHTSGTGTTGIGTYLYQMWTQTGMSWAGRMSNTGQHYNYTSFHFVQI